MTIPCRCRRRGCEARRSISRPLELYTREPRCRACGGRLRVDKVRAEGREKHASVCTDTLCPYPESHCRKTGVLLPFHRVSTRGCSGYEEWVISKEGRAQAHTEECPW